MVVGAAVRGKDCGGGSLTWRQLDVAVHRSAEQVRAAGFQEALKDIHLRSGPGKQRPFHSCGETRTGQQACRLTAHHSSAGRWAGTHAMPVAALTLESAFAMSYRSAGSALPLPLVAAASRVEGGAPPPGRCCSSCRQRSSSFQTGSCRQAGGQACKAHFTRGHLVLRRPDNSTLRRAFSCL